MKNIIIIIMFTLYIMGPLYAQNTTPPAGAINAANEGFVSFLTQALNEDTKTILGFDADDDLSKAVLGEPFKLYDLSENTIRNYDETLPLDSMLTETGLWYFPIKIDDVNKMVLYVGKNDGDWSRVGLGSAPLAGHLQNIAEEWPVEKGYTPQLIKQLDIGGYLYSIPQIEEPNLMEIKSILSRMGLAKKSAALKPLKETMQDLKQRIYQ